MYFLFVITVSFYLRKKMFFFSFYFETKDAKRILKQQVELINLKDKRKMGYDFSNGYHTRRSHS